MNVRVLSLERNDKKCPKKPTKQKQSKTKQKQNRRADTDGFSRCNMLGRLERLYCSYCQTHLILKLSKF